MAPQKGYKQEFIESYDEYAEAIFRYCLFRVFDRERAKELMQEAFTKTWEYLSGGNEIKNLRAFLYKVAHNLCVNEAIKHKAFSLDEMRERAGFDPEDEYSRSLEEGSEISILLRKIEELAPQEGELLKLRYIDDMAVSDIAELLGMLPNTVSVKIRRAEESLRKLFE